MLKDILQQKPTWIHLTDTYKRLPLHYAASIGYLVGVVYLTGKCKCCTNQRDKYGYFPIHLASYGGHVEVVEKLLEYCPDPTEMLDTSFKRNILHVAAYNGKHEVVDYILQQSRRICELDKMINQKDNKGDTPLHLAAQSCHPKAVFYLTWDERVDMQLVNQNNQTAVEVINASSKLRNSSAREQLTRMALNSAGVKPRLRRLVHDKARQSDTNLPLSKPSNAEPFDTKQQTVESDSKSNENKETDRRYFFLTGSDKQFRDRVETLTLVSTLIITASVAACFAVPGEADGKANNLCHAMFHVFIIFITISLFSSISSTIILFWAKLGIPELVTFSLKIVMPLLGIALVSLSLAFMAGLYTVISELTWLANVFLVVASILVVVVFLSYIVLFVPSSSTKKPLRLISYYPFLFLAYLAENQN
ncbi:putative ankyrin repeat-containing domain, PGG domain, protein accelerated cell death 6 [Medicago truncatula]|nr:putative ankyrin repeat-containing domain, PGG domain, protein accelerated cell death 6 [Medicago truncatula]